MNNECWLLEPLHPPHVCTWKLNRYSTKITFGKCAFTLIAFSIIVFRIMIRSMQLCLCIAFMCIGLCTTSLLIIIRFLERDDFDLITTAADEICFNDFPSQINNNMEFLWTERYPEPKSFAFLQLFVSFALFRPNIQCKMKWKRMFKDYFPEVCLCYWLLLLFMQAFVERQSDVLLTLYF